MDTLQYSLLVRLPCIGEEKLNKDLSLIYESP